MLPAAASARIATGTYTGNQANGRAITDVGFRPDLVLLKMDENYPALLALEALPAGMAKAFSWDAGLYGGMITSLDDDGFTISSADWVNKNGKRVDWLALTVDPGRMEIGTYTGDWQDGRAVDVGFQPHCVWVIPEDFYQSVYRSDTLAGDLTLPFDDEGSLGNRIESLTDTGFTVGNDAAINEAGRTYHWVAWRADPGLSQTGEYLGNGNDNRLITGLEVRPHWLMIKSIAGHDGTHLPLSLNGTGDALYFDHDNSDQNRIQDLRVNNFQIGSDNDVNEEDSRYHWFALGRSADLEVSVAADRATVFEGDAVVYTVSLTNNGPDRAELVEVTDLLPAGLLVTGSVPSTGSYETTFGTWMVDRVEPGTTATLEIAAQVLPGTAGQTLVNTAEVSDFLDHDPDPLNDSDSVSLEILRRADLHVLGLADVTTAVPAQLVSLTVATRNNGPDAATDVVTGAALPAGLEYVSHSQSIGSYDPVLGEWIVGTLGAGALGSLQIQARVGAGTTGQLLTVPLSIGSDVHDPAPANDTDSISIRILGADLQLALAADVTEPAPDDFVTLILDLDNAGPDPVDGVVVSDLLPPGLIFVSSTPSQGEYDHNTGLWSVGSLDAGVAVELLLTVRVAGDASGLITNGAKINAASLPDPDPSDDTAEITLVIPGADVALALGVDQPAPNVGDAVLFTLTVENIGFAAASGLVVTDLLPAGLSFASATPSQGVYDPLTGEWSIGSLGAGASCVLLLGAAVDAGTGGATLRNDAAVTALDQTDENAANDQTGVDVVVQAADLHLVKSVDDPTPVQGGQAVFTLLLTNDGPDTATNVAVADTLPAGLLYLGSAADVGGYDPATGIWSLGSLPAGSTATLDMTVEAQLDVGGGDIAVNTARVTAVDQEDPDASNDASSAALTQQNADLNLTVSVDDPTPAAGDPVRLTLTLRNDGPGDVLTAVVRDTLVAGLRYVGHGPGGALYDPQAGTWNVGPLTVGQSGVLELDAMVDADASGRILQDVAHILFSDQADPDGTNNRVVTTLAVRAADLDLDWTLSDAAPTVDDLVRATLRLLNRGPDLLESATVDVQLPAGLALETTTVGQGVWDDVPGLWDTGAVADGDTATLAFDLRVLDGTIGTLQTLTAAVATARPADPTPDAGPTSDSATVRGADLVLDKTANVSLANEGETVLFTATVRNDGPDPVDGVVVSDTLPAHLVYLSHFPGTIVYDPVDGEWSVGSLQVGESASLFLQARIIGSTPGETIVNTAAVIASGLADPDAANDTAEAVVTVPAADLRTSLLLDVAGAVMGDPVVVTLEIANDGPDPATGVVAALGLPAGLLFRFSDSPSFDPAAGRWVVGELADGDVAVLHLNATVADGTAGGVLTVTAAPAEADQGDPQPANDASSVDLPVAPDADLSVAIQAVEPFVGVGDTLSWTLRVRNDGPSPALGIALRDTLPDGTTLLGWTATAGSYDAAAHRWTLASLPVGATAELRLDSSVDPGNGGDDLRAACAVTERAVSDRDPADDHAAAWAHVSGADLALESFIDLETPLEGSDVIITFSVSNLGPDRATGVTLLDSLPDGLAYVSHTPPSESYAAGPDGAGVWDVGTVDGQTPRVLFVRTRVRAGTTGTLLRHGAEVFVADQEDPDPANNRTVNLLAVEGTDLLLSVDPGDTRPEEGGLVTTTLSLVNLGPQPATGLAVVDSLASGFEFVSAEPAEAFDPATGLWSIGALDRDALATLELTLRVAPLTGGTTLFNRARVAASDQVDPQPDNDAVVVAYDVSVPGTGRVAILQTPLADASVRPLAAPAAVLRLRVVNRTVRVDTLTALIVSNAMVGDGTPADLDAAWSGLQLWARREGDWTFVSELNDGFQAGVGVFAGLGLELAAVDSLELELRGAPSATARDGDALALRLEDVSAFVFASEVAVDGTWPLDTSAALLVDGFVAAQAGKTPVPTGILAPGETERPVLDVTLPSDGYAPATLRSLRVVNRGTARAGFELEAVQAWLDDGDGALVPGPDELLGGFAWTGDGWVLSGLERTIPPGGARILVSVDTSPGAEGQRTVQMAVPAGGVEVDDGNDGPIDAALVNDYQQVVSDTERLYLGAATSSWRTVDAGGSEHQILHLTVTNTFDGPRTITSLRFTNTSVSPWTADTDTLDAALGQIVLRDDAGDDGLPGSGDAVLGAATMSGGEAVVSGLSWTVPPATTRHLFVNVRPDAENAAHGDNLALMLGSAVDVQVSADADLFGAWPLSSGGGLVIDGTRASRFLVTPQGSAMAPPGAVNRLLLDLTAPPNGHAVDVIERFSVVDNGNAGLGDLAVLRLWRDGGDGIFDGLTDALLGELTHVAGVWSLDHLDVPVPNGGVRLFVDCDLAAAARDSVVVSLALPVDGVRYASGAAGPMDATVGAGTSLLVGSGALLCGIAAEPVEAVVGQTVTVRLDVVNGGAIAVDGVAPAPLGLTGDGRLDLLTGPTPASADLAPGEDVQFVWTLNAAEEGTLVATGAASGLAAADPVASLPISTAPLRIATAPPELGLSALSQLPFAVNGGQNDVSALTLTLNHRGGPASAAVRLDSLTIRLENAGGQPVSAGGVLDRVILRADGLLLHAETVAPDAGSSLVLVPSFVPRLGAGEDVVVTVGVELAETAAGAEFRFLVDSDGIAAHDAVAGRPVGVVLDNGQFPVRSELTLVVAGAPALLVADGEHAAGEASLGQTGVILSRLVFTNPGVAELGAGIQLGVVPLVLVDADAAPLADPSSHLIALELRRGSNVLARLEQIPSTGGEMILSLATPLNIGAAEPVALDIVADLHVESPLGRLGVRYAGDTHWDARDANSGVPVPVVLDPDPLLTAGVPLVSPALLAHVGGRALGAEVLTGGARNQPVLEVAVRNPGDLHTAPVSVDTLVVRCLDGAGAPLVAANVLDRLTVRLDDVVVGLGPAGSAADGRIRIPLADVLCGPGATVLLRLEADVRADVLTDQFVLTLDLPDLCVVDAHLVLRSTLTADSGVVLPLSSGVRRVRIAADELVVDAIDRMPATVAALGVPVPALDLSFANTAGLAAGDLLVTEIALAARGAAGDAVLGELVGVVTALFGGEVWGVSGAPQAGDSLVVVAGESGLRIPPGESRTLELRFEPIAGSRNGSLSIGFGLDDVSVRQPEGDLVTVRVLPAPGRVFPFWTQRSTLSAATLAESYSNFPNPFAAGREATTFVFALTGPSTVDLRVYTPRGEPVRTVLSAEHRGAGLHQDVIWDGRNGNGDPVRNGVYIAEITVREENGAATTLRRKVAVVR